MHIMDREIAVQSIYGVLWSAEIVRIIQLSSLILLDLFAVFFDKINVLTGAITRGRQFSYIVEVVFGNLETNLGILRSFKLLRMDILCKLGVFSLYFSYLCCISELTHTLISSCYIPEMPQNVIVYPLAYKADFRFKGDLLLWSQPITLQVGY